MELLLISENRETKSQIENLFPDDSISVRWEKNLNKMIPIFKSETPGVLIITSTVWQENDNDCFNMLKTVATKSPATKIILLVDPDHMHIMKTALKAGTYQYARLPLSSDELKLLIETAFDQKPQFAENLLLEECDTERKIGQFIGNSSVMQSVYRQIRQAAVTDIPVLLMGETGTGKDLAAATIHRFSDRKESPYIAVNLGALPSELVASELFGHEKGAFTGAVNRHKGVFEQAGKGTVFLDEIDFVNEKVQVSLLRLIDGKKFNRLGGRHSIQSNAGLIAATNANLEDLLEKGSFREDLFYRLDVLRITMPPLRQRQTDILPLVQEHLARYNSAFKKNISSISPDCLAMLEAYDWPGNIRELKNVIQRAVLLCQGDELLPKHLPVRFRIDDSVSYQVTFDIHTPLARVEKEMVLRALAAAKNNRRKAAEILGISRRAIYNKIKKHNIDEQ
jgi:DNA-binding NtrC family response regulator